MTTAAEKKAAEDKAAAEKAEADRKAAEEKAAAERKDGDDAKGENERPPATEQIDGNGLAQPADTAPGYQTTTDSQGVDRIVASGVQDGWEPAPTEASDEEKERAKEREKKAEEEAEARREGRIDPVSGKLLSKEEHAEAEKARKAREKEQSA